MKTNNEYIMEFEQIGSRELLKNELAKCSDNEINIFNGLYGSVDDIEFSKMPIAYGQIKRTLDKRTESK